MKMRKQKHKKFHTVTYKVAAEWWASMFRSPHRCKKVFQYTQEQTK